MLTSLRIPILMIIVCALPFLKLNAQTPSDAIMMDKHQICTALIGGQSKWSSYWEGTNLRENPNVGTLTSRMFMPMAAYGITSKINIIAGAPLISNSASGGQFATETGFQDVLIGLKYHVFGNTLKRLNGFASATFSTPISNYNSDYLPLGLGLGTQEYGLRAVLYYRLVSGIYVRGSGAYLHRTFTKLDREFHYNNGAQYGHFADVPSVVQYDAALGAWLLDESLQVEASFMANNSISGDDIIPQQAPQVTNQMDANSFNARVKYYLPFAKSWSLMAGYGQVVSGRNVGKASGFNVGATYQFYTHKSQE